MVRSARYLGNSCKHGDADADRKQQSTRPSEARVSLVQEAVKSGHDRVEQPGYLPCGGCRPRAGRAREQKTPHEGDDRIALSTQTDSTTHHQLTLPGMLGHPHEQRVGRICPCQHVERPGVLHRRAAYGTAYSPPLHPAAQPRTSGQRFDPVAADTIPAHLHRTDGRTESVPPGDFDPAIESSCGSTAGRIGTHIRPSENSLCGSSREPERRDLSCSLERLAISAWKASSQGRVVFFA